MRYLIAIIALVVLASPIDIWPDFLPFGSIDDIILFGTVCAQFQKEIDAWAGNTVEGAAEEKAA
jgi:uncharacterized membrane protein YkvA (DUF1232 family)